LEAAGEINIATAITTTFNAFPIHPMSPVPGVALAKTEPLATDELGETFIKPPNNLRVYDSNIRANGLTV
jgi:hypothetical protein